MERREYITVMFIISILLLSLIIQNSNQFIPNAKVGFYPELLKEYYFPYNNSLEPQLSIIPWENGIVVPSVSTTQGTLNISYILVTPNSTSLLLNITSRYIPNSLIMASAYTNGYQIVFYYKNIIANSIYQQYSYLYPTRLQIPDFTPPNSLKSNIPNTVYNSTIVLVSYYPNQPGWYFLYNTITNYKPITGVPLFASAYGEDLLKGGKYNIVYLANKNSTGSYLLAYLYTNPYELYQTKLIWSYKLDSENVWAYQIGNSLILYNSNKIILFFIFNFSINKIINLSNTTLQVIPIGILNSSLYFLNQTSKSISICNINSYSGLIKNVITLSNSYSSNGTIVMMYSQRNVSLVINNSVYLIDVSNGKILYNITVSNAVAAIGDYVYSAERMGNYLKLSIYQVKWGEIPTTTTMTRAPSTNITNVTTSKETTIQQTTIITSNKNNNVSTQSSITTQNHTLVNFTTQITINSYNISSNLESTIGYNNRGTLIIIIVIAAVIISLIMLLRRRG
ncbi:MAG: hypothetical protein QXV69_08890 [Sulfolobaceae archaeon]